MWTSVGAVSVFRNIWTQAKAPVLFDGLCDVEWAVLQETRVLMTDTDSRLLTSPCLWPSGVGPLSLAAELLVDRAEPSSLPRQQLLGLDLYLPEAASEVQEEEVP